VHFDASSIPPKQLEKADLPSWKKVMVQAQSIVDTGEKQKKSGSEITRSEDHPKHAATKYDETTISVAEEATMGASYDIDRQKTVDPYTGIKKPLEFYRTETAKKYVGEKIMIDFYRTNITNVFRIIREISGENIAIDKDVTGEVTMTLEKPLPWDQVLSLVMKMNKLGLKYEEGVLRIATLTTLAEEEAERGRKLAAKREAENQEELITAFIPISYVEAIEIGKHLVIDGIFTNNQGKSKFNPERGKVSIDTTNNMIVMSDVARSIKRAKEIIQRLDMVTPQVIIEARIVEASANFSREIGVEWNVGTGDKGIESAALGGTYDYDMAMNVPITDPAATIGFNFLRIAGTPFLLNAKLMAMEAEGEGKIISSPKIVTLDNKEATIEQGFEYPDIYLDESGNTVTRWKKINLELKVTPHVTPDQRISMNINIEKMDLGDVISGRQTFTITWLSKIPVLGWLFKTESKKDDKEEMLIFITPRIVQLEQRDLIDD
jgi:type IV pilus assembly protein PilQ